MPRRPAPLPHASGTLLLPEQARATGVSPTRLRASDVTRPFHGLYELGRNVGLTQLSDEAPLARDRAQRAAVLAHLEQYRPLMSNHSFLVGRTAAVVHGLPIRHGADLEVGVFSPDRAARRRGIRGRKVSARLVTIDEHNGFRLSSPATTWAMLGRELSLRELVVIGDAIVQVPRDNRGRPDHARARGTISQLLDAADASRRPAAPKLREAASLIRVGSSSPLESEYRLDAASGGLPEPELDVEIRTSHGRLIGITEIVYRRWRVLVEIEGDHHRTSPAQWNRDIEKYAAYVAEGWEVIRLTAAHIRGPAPQAVRIVRNVLRRRSALPFH